MRHHGHNGQAALREAGIPIAVAAMLACSGSGCRAQSTAGDNVGGALENRDFVYQGMPTRFSAADTSAGWKLDGQKILLTGTVFQPDGTTPAPDVMIYYYQTNPAGRYVHKPDEPRSMAPNELGQTHGFIRGWVRTDANGSYRIYTVRPGTYPSGDFPAHVHATIKEPSGINEYYIDDFVFDDDRLLTAEYRQRMETRCGSGVVKLVEKDGLSVGERNMVLGLNIPGHPARTRAGAVAR